MFWRSTPALNSRMKHEIASWMTGFEGLPTSDMARTILFLSDCVDFYLNVDDESSGIDGKCHTYHITAY